MSTAQKLDLNKLAKGDKLKTYDGKVYTFIELNQKGSVTCRGEKGRIFSLSRHAVEYDLEKCYPWSDWRSVPQDSNALYKTNRKRIWYKKGNIKVKCDCNIKEDKFDLKTGLELCKKRWQEKYDISMNKVQEYVEKQNYLKREVLNKETLNKDASNEMNLILCFENRSIFEAPFYAHIVHCINTDCGIHGFIGKTLDGYYGLSDIYKNGSSDYKAVYKDECTDDYVLMTYKNIISLLVSPPHEKATYEQLERCLHELAWYCFSHNIQNLAMPKICCGKNGLEWDKVRTLIMDTFDNTFDEFMKYNPGVYTSKNPYRLIITIYEG